MIAKSINDKTEIKYEVSW